MNTYEYVIKSIIFFTNRYMYDRINTNLLTKDLGMWVINISQKSSIVLQLFNLGRSLISKK